MKMYLSDVPVICPGGNRDNPIHFINAIDHLTPHHIAVQVIHRSGCKMTGKSPMDGCTCDYVDIILEEVSTAVQAIHSREN